MRTVKHHTVNITFRVFNITVAVHKRCYVCEPGFTIAAADGSGNTLSTGDSGGGPQILAPALHNCTATDD